MQDMQEPARVLILLGREYHNCFVECVLKSWVKLVRSVSAYFTARSGVSTEGVQQGFTQLLHETDGANFPNTEKI
jgi:hypothetical protein